MHCQMLPGLAASSAGQGKPCPGTWPFSFLVRASTCCLTTCNGCVCAGMPAQRQRATWALATLASGCLGFLLFASNLWASIGDDMVLLLQCRELGTDEEQTLLDSAHTSIIKAARRGEATLRPAVVPGPSGL